MNRETLLALSSCLKSCRFKIKHFQNVYRFLCALNIYFEIPNCAPITEWVVFDICEFGITSFVYVTPKPVWQQCGKAGKVTLSQALLENSFSFELCKDQSVSPLVFELCNPKHMFKILELRIHTFMCEVKQQSNFELSFNFFV